MRRASRLGLLGVGVGAVMMAGVLDAQGEFTERRAIVAVMPRAQQAEFTTRVSALRCQLADRDVDVFVLDATELAIVRHSGGQADALPVRLAQLIDADAGEMQLVLIGKDGGVKARAATLDALDAFLDRIDGMPMRRAEMARRGGPDRDCG